jgi:hypothetical protein
MDGREFEDLDGGRANGHDAGAERPRSRFHIITDSELEQLTPAEQLIDGLIAAESVNLYVGAPGSLKSFLALDQIACIQTGRAWAGRTVRQGHGLYVLAEGAKNFGLRTRAWKAHHGHQGPLGVSFLPQPVQLAERGDVSDLLKAIEQLPALPVKIFVDTQARCAVGLEENSATAMGQLIAGVERLQRETAAAVTLLHHSPRDADRERGSSALRGAVDTILVLTADGDHLTVRVDRQKDGEAGAALRFRKRVVDLEDGRTSCVLVPVSEHEQRQGPAGIGDVPPSVRTLLDALRNTFPHGSTSTQLLKATGLPERTFYNAIRAAKGWDLIDSDGKSNRITPLGRTLYVEDRR